MELQAFTGNLKINLGLINLSYRGRARHVTNNATYVSGAGPPSSGLATE
jgi:hypothetical protein